MVEQATDGAVVISYETLCSSPEVLVPSIGESSSMPSAYPMPSSMLTRSSEKAFGSEPDCLGIIVIRDLPPEFLNYRERLLKLAFRFGNLDEAVREKHSDPTTKYSHSRFNKEIMNGKPDTLKGSYYANPIGESNEASGEEKKEFPEYYGKNIWPAENEPGVEGFEGAFKDLSRFIFEVGCKLAAACQPFATSHLLDSTVLLADLIKDSPTTKARLLHYFPPPPRAIQSNEEDDAIDNWCGFHLDHSLITGLCPAMFLRPTANGEPEIVTNPSPLSGLYIRTRGGDLRKVSVPSNCLAFQTGEALEVATDKKLRATPHCVRIAQQDGGSDISRESFALFMQPHTNQLLNSTTTFGKFSKQIFAEHYNSDSM
ncbi:Clavaminate synthase-like protein [Panaeolus papilionaceus]|nr:Clavaminate synthase-like protein [Panaeolus papilionaceus]